MKAEPHRSFFLSTILVIVALNSATLGQSAKPSELTPLSETDAFTAVTLARNPTTRLAAAEEFFAKYPDSKSRLKIAELVVEELVKVKNPTVALTLIDRARTIFTKPDELDILKTVTLQAYTGGNRSEEAFALARELLTGEPDNLEVLTKMTFAGAEEAKRKGRKHTELALQYGLRAIVIIESGIKPANMDQQAWVVQQSNLSGLYQQTGILSLALGESEAAKSRLTRASELSQHDPTNFALLGRVLSSEYSSKKLEYESITDGELRTQKLKSLDGVLDRIIDSYARAIALATGRPEYQVMIQQVVPDLAAFYRNRHQSAQGLQQLINQYRVKRK